MLQIYQQSNKKKKKKTKQLLTNLVLSQGLCYVCLIGCIYLLKTFGSSSWVAVRSSQNMFHWEPVSEVVILVVDSTDYFLPYLTYSAYYFL